MHISVKKWRSTAVPRAGAGQHSQTRRDVCQCYVGLNHCQKSGTKIKTEITIIKRIKTKDKDSDQEKIQAATPTQAIQRIESSSLILILLFQLRRFRRFVIIAAGW